MATNCQRCGHESTAAFPRALYSCQAPYCQLFQAVICHNCWIKLGAQSGAFGNPETCPACHAGELKYLGNR
jgi:hypothetical protein